MRCVDLEWEMGDLTLYSPVTLYSLGRHCRTGLRLW